MSGWKDNKEMNASGSSPSASCSAGRFLIHWSWGRGLGVAPAVQPGTPAAHAGLHFPGSPLLPRLANRCGPRGAGPGHSPAQVADHTLCDRNDSDIL